MPAPSCYIRVLQKFDNLYLGSQCGVTNLQNNRFGERAQACFLIASYLQCKESKSMVVYNQPQRVPNTDVDDSLQELLQQL